MIYRMTAERILNTGAPLNLDGARHRYWSREWNGFVGLHTHTDRQARYALHRLLEDGHQLADLTLMAVCPSHPRNDADTCRYHPLDPPDDFSHLAENAEPYPWKQDLL